MTVEEIFSFGSNFFTFGFLSFLITTLISFALAHIVTNIVKKTVDRYSAIKKDENKAGVSYIYQTIRALVYAFACFVSFYQVNPLRTLGSALLGATSLLAVVGGLAAQETFGNYIAGFFLAFYQPYKVGDFIMLPEKNMMGTVKEMTFRHTVIESIEHSMLIIPNSVMNTAIIDDKSSDQVVTRYLLVTVGYDTIIQEARQIILDILEKESLMVDTRTEQEKKDGKPISDVLVNNLGASGIELRIPVSCQGLGPALQICSNVRESIIEQFRIHNILIPYQTITLDVPEGKAVFTIRH